MDAQDYRSIIESAITNEVEAYSFYQRISETVQDTNLKGLFKELADEETGHRKLLQGFLTREPTALHFDAKKNYKLGEMLETPPLTADLKPVDGLAIAIKKELSAMQMYTQFANLTTDDEEKKMFLELAKMEAGHKARLEDLYTNMAFPEAW